MLCSTIKICSHFEPNATAIIDVQQNKNECNFSVATDVYAFWNIRNVYWRAISIGQDTYVVFILRNRVDDKHVLAYIKITRINNYKDWTDVINTITVIIKFLNNVCRNLLQPNRVVEFSDIRQKQKQRIITRHSDRNMYQRK